MLEAVMRKSYFLSERENIILLVPSVESYWFLLFSQWPHQLSNFVSLQILWKWSLSWRGNWGDDQTIQFPSQTRGGNLPLISFYRIIGGLLYLKSARCLQGGVHQCCCTQGKKYGRCWNQDLIKKNAQVHFVMYIVWLTTSVWLICGDNNLNFTVSWGNVGDFYAMETSLNSCGTFFTTGNFKRTLYMAVEAIDSIDRKWLFLWTTAFLISRCDKTFARKIIFVISDYVFHFW